MKKIVVVKKDGTHIPFSDKKIVNAVTKSARRVLVDMCECDISKLCQDVLDYIKSNGKEYVTVTELHNIVETKLDCINPKVASSYREYRNYKTDFVSILDEVYKKAQVINHRGDKENSNTDSCLVSTKRSLIYNELNKELYNKFFLTVEEKQACRDGYIYIHDKAARRDSIDKFVA